MMQSMRFARILARNLRAVLALDRAERERLRRAADDAWWFGGRREISERCYLDYPTVTAAADRAAAVHCQFGRPSDVDDRV
jgi:hypothetical protein